MVCNALGVSGLQGGAWRVERVHSNGKQRTGAAEAGVYAGSGGGASNEDILSGFDLPVAQRHMIGVLESPMSWGR